MTREVLEHIFEPFFTTKPLGVGNRTGTRRGARDREEPRWRDHRVQQAQQGNPVPSVLPVVEGTATRPPQAAPAPAKGDGQHILYLDDEEALVLLARRLLERLGYKVSGYSSAAEALATFEAAPDQFDLVLSDLSMPGINGLDVARRVLEIRPEIPVLLASGLRASRGCRACPGHRRARSDLEADDHQ